MVSVPERALLELFCDTGKLQSLEETLNVAEGVRHLRPDDHFLTVFLMGL